MGAFWIGIFEILVIVVEGIVVCLYMDHKHDLSEKAFDDLFVAVIIANILTFIMGATFEMLMH